MNKKLKIEYKQIDQIIDCEEFLECFRQGFAEGKDPRIKQQRTYHLGDLLFMIMCAVIAGANTITHIHDYVQYKAELFQRLLEIDQVPSYTVFWRLLVRLNPQHLQETFCKWIQALPTDIKEKVIAIDGKHLRGASTDSSSRF